MKYVFSASNIVVEASSEEDALRQVASRLSAVIRHVSDGVALADNKPFFTLTKTDAGEPTDLTTDPIVQARVEAEAAKVAAEEPTPAPDAASEAAPAASA